MSKPNPFAYPAAITLDTLPNLFAHHASRFGGWRMEAEGEGGEGGPGDGAPAGDAKTFTQEQVNAMLAEQKRKSGEKFADYADLKAKAAKLDEIEAASASELEKAVKAATAEATGAERARVSGILAAAEARAQASERFQNPATAVKLLDLSSVAVTDEGEVDGAAVKGLLDSLAESDPYLLKATKPAVPTPGQAGIGVTGGAPTPTTPQGRLRASIEQDIAAGRRT
ncbi:hypothetical protein J2X46_002706 [Nocardioides sp. BE266]|uniref:hypothetical protein n=1 Tax=Nocardioides sp. BE266 TaxID=2817725 RepID=UPI00285D1A66|nr:hypothetical protein [Nocardioides sp. BE266]MDR7253716.1 hypothetical protein [Nocardioides sp. BE266]